MNDDEKAEVSAWISMITEQAENQHRAELAYEATRALGKLSQHRLIAYRCERRGCLLLEVLRFPDPVGIVLHTPRYKRDPEVNKRTSNEAGRAANTEDGDRRWKANIFVPSQAINYTLNCDHITHYVLDEGDVNADIESGRTKVIIRP